MPESTAPLWRRRGGRLIPVIEGELVYVDQLQVTSDATTHEFSLGGRFNFDTVEEPDTITVALAGLGAGNLENGTRRYKVTYHNEFGETKLSAVYDTLVVTDKTVDGQAEVTIPISSDEKVTARSIYRNKVTGSTSSYYFVATVSDNTTTSYIDNIADASLPVGDYRNRDDTTSGLFYKEGVKYAFFGENNFAFGQWALGVTQNAAGWWNFGLGTYVMKDLTTGTNNTGIGTYSLISITSGSNNAGIGAQACYSTTTGNDNTGVGYQSLWSVSVNRQNVGVGGQSAFSFTGSYIVALGYQAIYTAALGNGAIGIGRQTFYGATNVSGMVGIGYQAGYAPAAVTANKCTTSTNCTFVGFQSGLGSTTQRTNAIAIGYYAVVDADNMCVIGGAGSNAVTLRTTGGRIRQINTTPKTTGYAITATDEVILCDTSGGAFQVNLPASPEDGREYRIILDVAGNNLTISGNGKNIDGSGSVVTGVVGVYYFIYNGTQWNAK